MQSWSLANGAELAAANKYTFYRPSAAAIGKVAVGDNVKLIFEYDNDNPDGWTGERMWVLVDRIDGQGHFRGRLDNDPRHISDLHAGDTVEFSDIHIIQVEHDDDSGDNIVSRYRPRCFVTARVLHDGAPIGYLYREAPELGLDDDSGWRIMAGDETAEYMDNPENSFYVSLGAVLNRDDAILPLLDAKVGSTFERLADGGGFVPVEDNA
jgi:hypothetical protein